MDIKKISSSKVVHEEEETFVFEKEPTDDAFMKDDNDFDFEIKFECKEDESNQSNNIDDIVFKTSSGLWKCNMCEKETNKRGHMRNHAEKHIPGLSYSCSTCEKSCDTRRKLRIHQKKVHNVREKISPKNEICNDSFACDECEYKATTRAKISLHKKVKHCNQDHVCKQ